MRRSRADLRIGVIQLLSGATLISFSAVFVKLAHVGPTTSGFYRLLFGGLFLLAIVALRGESLWRGRRSFLFAVVAAVLFAADISCWHRAIVYLGPGLATIMGNFQVFFLAAFGVAVLREKVDFKFVLSVPLAVAGLTLIVGVDWPALESRYKSGIYFGLATAVTYAAYLLVLRRSRREAGRMTASANLAVISIVAAMILGVEARLQGEAMAIPDAGTWISLLSYGVICQALGWIIISPGLAAVDASRAGLILLLQPTLSFVWDVLFFDRPTDRSDVAGAVLALAAIYLGGARRGRAVEEDPT